MTVWMVTSSKRTICLLTPCISIFQNFYNSHNDGLDGDVIKTHNLSVFFKKVFWKKNKANKQFFEIFSLFIVAVAIHHNYFCYLFGGSHQLESYS